MSKDVLKNGRNIFPLISFIWLIFNVIYVFAFRGGEGIHRVESALIIFIIAVLTAATFTTEKKVKGNKIKNSAYITGFVVFFWFLAMYQTLTLPFLSDDLVFAAQFSEWNNIFLQYTYFRPAFILVFSTIYNLFDGSVVPFHLLSMILHLWSAFLVRKLITRIFKSSFAGLAGFSLFLLNPMQSEAVAWISGLQELMWSFFILMGLWIFIRDDGIRWKKTGVIMLLTIAALLSKETAISFVAIYLLADLVINGWKKLIEHRNFHLCSISIAILYLPLRSVMVTPGGDGVKLPDLYMIKSMLLAPYEFLFTPWNSEVVGELTGIRVTILLIICLSLLLMALKGRSFRTLLLGSGVVLFSTIPVNKMLFIGNDLQGSRYLYFSFAGGIIIIISLLGGLKNSRKAGPLILIALIIFSAVLLKFNMEPWRIAGNKISEIRSRLAEGKEVQNVPDNYKGAYILRNGWKELKQMEQKPKT